MENNPNTPIEHSQSMGQSKLQELERMRSRLKSEFIGIDEVIDRVVDSMRSWYVMPELRDRPLTINLWGMTGTGKTTLVQRIVALLGLEQHFHTIDMSRSDAHKVDDDLEEIAEQNAGRPFIVMFDEFQQARTIGTNNNEWQFRGKALVNFWRLLDSGMIEMLKHDRSVSNIREVIATLKYAVNRGLKAQNGSVTEGREMLCRLLVTPSGSRWGGFSHGSDIDRRVSELMALKHMSLLSSNSLSDIMDLSRGRFVSVFELTQYLGTLDELQTLDFLQELTDIACTPQRFDCTKALVFVAGNLDEAYGMAKDLSQEMPASVWTKLVRDITVQDVKKALHERFRAEQVARLGNNHILYPALSKEMYLNFIDRQLDGISQSVSLRFGLSMRFDPSVSELLYQQGVSPTQGFRPVLSTIDVLIRSQVPEVLFEARQQCAEADEAELSCAEDLLHVKFSQEGEFCGSCELRLNLTRPLRQSMEKGERQALIAVHEAGHVICSSMLLGQVPDAAVLLTSGGGSGVTVRLGRDTIHNRQGILHSAACHLGGYAAELVLFGEQGLTVGSESDIGKATTLVREALSNSGLSGMPVNYQNVNGRDGAAVIDVDHEADMQTKRMVTEALGIAKGILEDQHELLVRLADRLLEEGALDRKQLEEAINLWSRPSERVNRPNFAYRKILRSAFEKLAEKEAA
jgi:hypothetical protein